MDENKLPETLLRVAQVAAVLDVSRAQVYRLIKLGQIPARFFGKSVRIRRIDLISLINGNGSSGRNDRQGEK